MVLYVQNIKRNKKYTVSSILTELFQHYSPYSLPATFHDKDCKNQEFQKYKHRSFEVILAVIKSFFPNITEKKLAKELEKILIANKDVTFLFCNTANKWIFHNRGIYWTNRDDDYCTDYNGAVKTHTLKNSKGTGKYSLEDILKLMKE